MARYYQPEVKSKKAAGARPHFEMALEIYIDKPAVSNSLFCQLYEFTFASLSFFLESAALLRR